MTINGRLQITAYPDGGTTIFTVKVSPLSGNEINIANDALSKLVGVR
jgi:hypothetical protein